MRFLTPDEKALLDSLPETEAHVVRALFEECDARLIDDLSFNYVYTWGNNEARAELKGKRCRVVVWGGAMNTILVEFEDGTKVSTSRHAVRLVTEGDQRHGEQIPGHVQGPVASPSATSQSALFPMRKEGP